MATLQGALFVIFQQGALGVGFFFLARVERWFFNVFLTMRCEHFVYVFSPHIERQLLCFWQAQWGNCVCVCVCVCVLHCIELVALFTKEDIKWALIVKSTKVLFALFFLVCPLSSPAINLDHVMHALGV